MNIIKVSKKEFEERKSELEVLILNGKNAICISDKNGEEEVLINKKALVKILVNNEKANEFARELTFGNESYEEVLDGIEREINDPNAIYYSQKEFENILWRRFGDDGEESNE